MYVQPYRELLLGDVRTPLYVLLASVALVLAIGCVNVASLLLAQANVRRREMAIRTAIGGGRWRIVRQLLTESVMLALLGGVVGIGLASVGIRLLVAYAPANVPRLQDAGLQPEVLLFALGLTIATGLAFGLAPALRTARENLLSTLREGGRNSLPAAGSDRLRAILVVGEIALAVVLLVGAGLFIRSAWRLQQVPLGFDPSGVSSARLALPAERYRGDDAVADAYRRMLESARATPGIQFGRSLDRHPVRRRGSRRAHAGRRQDVRRRRCAQSVHPADYRGLRRSHRDADRARPFGASFGYGRWRAAGRADQRTAREPRLAGREPNRQASLDLDAAGRP